MQEIYELFKKYGAMMASQGYELGEEARIVLDTYEGVYGTKKGANLANLRWKDIVKMSDNHFGNGKSGMIARVISQTPYCQKCLEEGFDIPAVLDDMAQIVGPKAALVNVSDGSKKSALKMAKAISQSSGILVQDRVRDGKPAGYTLTVGRSLYEAVVAMTVLEKSAEIYIKARAVGGAKPISKWESMKMRNFYMEKYSKSEQDLKAAESAKGRLMEEEEEEGMDLQWSEKEALGRQQLVEYGNKLVETGLVQGTWGNLSYRIDDQYMLVTPSGMDYARLTPADMVKVNIHTLDHEGTLKPTSEKGIHGSIYKNRPEVGAVIHTHSKYCAVFASAVKDMPIVGEEAKAVFGDKIAVAKHAGPGTDKLMKYTVSALGDNYGCLMANHGMVACGADMETAFEHCCMLETSGEAYINERL